MTTQTMSLYINDNGMMSCIAHAGSYISSAYAAKPEAAKYRTPLDTWERIDTDFIVEWTDMMGSAPKCESCR
ncbi:MAG TPA: hypothetical protein VIG24_12610 [Acidimicrobiia bacterium]